MNPALRDDPRALRLLLSVPTTQVRLGPLTFDGLEALVGVPLDQLLSPLMIGPRSQRSTDDGGLADVFPLAIPDGEGLTLPIRLVGEVGFRNHRGLLILIVPAGAAELVEAQLAEELAARKAAGPRMNRGSGGGYVAEFALRLEPGRRKAVPLGKWGEVGVEAG